MDLVMTLKINAVDEDSSDFDLSTFTTAIRETFEDRYSADPSVSYETDDGQEFEITHNEVTIDYTTD